jgi:CHAD domain-containing protein
MRALKRDESVHDAIQLVVKRSTRASLALLTGGENSTFTDEAIHDLRKRIKVIRSLLRLVRADMGDRQFPRANRCFREANLPRSDVRDAQVALTRCDGLMGRCDALDTERMRLHRSLERALEEARVRVATSPRTRRIVAEKLRRAERLVSDWRASQGSWKDLSRGFRSIYAKGGDALKMAAVDKSDANLHELRKRAKDLLYACEFLRRASPRARSMFADLKRFTDLLGEHRDLAMLQRAVATGRLVHEGSLRWQLVKLACREQTSLRNRAWKIGLRIYDESAAAFVSRLHKDWRAWRDS